MKSLARCAYIRSDQIRSENRGWSYSTLLLKKKRYIQFGSDSLPSFPFFNRLSRKRERERGDGRKEEMWK
jgi:hypothetical protein